MASLMADNFTQHVLVSSACISIWLLYQCFMQCALLIFSIIIHESTNLLKVLSKPMKLINIDYQSTCIDQHILPSTYLPRTLRYYVT